MNHRSLSVAGRQLGRMRAMTGMYHRRFYADIWLTVAVYLAALAAASVGAGQLFAALPFIALFGAVVTAFDASYLIFARHYAARLERYINDRIEDPVLVGAALEDAYLFPLSTPKIVTIRAGRDFSWFGFVTVLFTVLGLAGFAYGTYLAFQEIATLTGRIWYLIALGPAAFGTLVAGLWWFVGGVGETRLTEVLDETFGD